MRIPLSEPLFLLGSLFILVVFFVPGGIAGLVERLRERRTGRAPATDADGGSSPGRATEQLREAMARGVGAAAPTDGV